MQQQLENIDFDMIQTEVHDDLRRSLGPGMLAPPAPERKRDVKAGRKSRGPRTRSNAVQSDSHATPNRHTLLPFMAAESSIGQITDSSFDAAELLSQLEKSYQECDNLHSERVRAEQIQRDAQLESTIEMRESIEQLRQENLLKAEQIAKLERDIEFADKQVSARIH